MSSPGYYTPMPPDYLDAVRYTQGVVEKILRNNPLTDAVVSDGLIRWIGNYTNAGNPDRINLLWIGEFLPADTNLPGSPPQRGFSLVRDDSRGGISAIAMFDPNPSGGGGLKQVLFFTSGDNDRLFEESRDGGQRWPEDNIWMGPLGNDLNKWPATTSGTFETLWEGRVNIVGNNIAYRVFCATLAGATGEFRLRVETPGGDTIGTLHTLGVTTSSVFDTTLNVSVGRGTTCTIRWEARRTNASGSAVASVISMRSFTP